MTNKHGSTDDFRKPSSSEKTKTTSQSGEKNDIAALREPPTFPLKRHTNKSGSTDDFCKPSSSEKASQSGEKNDIAALREPLTFSFEGHTQPGKASLSAARPWRRAETTRSKKENVSGKSQEDIIFFGNGPLANYTLDVLSRHFNIIFHARTKADLSKAAQLKHDHPNAHAVLASFGILIREDFLNLFEPEGILNIHPSLLPKYRGPSPIETAILAGDQNFSLSIMKLVKAMDAGPIYYQETLSFPDDSPTKDDIYRTLATSAATWLVDNLNHLPTPKPQEGSPTFTAKLTTDLSPLRPSEQTGKEMLNQIRAFQGFPKSRYTFFSLDCILLSAHLSPTFPENSVSSPISPDPSDKNLYTTKSSFALKAKDDNYLIIDRLQPAGKRPMSAPSFLNGYRK